MTSNAIVKAGRAMSTVAARHTMAPRAVLSELATRIFPTTAFSSPNNQGSGGVHTSNTKSHAMDVTKKIFYLSTDEIDPCDFGYRVVAPTEHALLYTSTEFSAGVNEQDETPSATCSTLGSIICSDEGAAEEVLAAQMEWDDLIEDESTRPHFEFYKEDPYAFEGSASPELFSCIDSHDNDDIVEDVKAAA